MSKCEYFKMYLLISLFLKFLYIAAFSALLLFIGLLSIFFFVFLFYCCRIILLHRFPLKVFLPKFFSSCRSNQNCLSCLTCSYSPSFVFNFVLSCFSFYFSKDFHLCSVYTTHVFICHCPWPIFTTILPFLYIGSSIPIFNSLVSYLVDYFI